MIVCVPWDNADATALRWAQLRDVTARYQAPMPATDPEPHGLVAMVVAYVDGVPAACGALVDVTGQEPEFGVARTAEVRRVYVDPQFRGQGLARQVMQTLDAQAQQAGVAQLVLASGTAQPESVALYVSEGFEPMSPYGVNKQYPTSLFFWRALNGAALSA
ncbi:GNAT family N-acetyltransferase [Jonesia denitrificans]|uniref:GCN5-related N-acetyltransferase n=1 Tax=Jonesia denitrificans (strain ATCC 14870 / DSM 20603 / BCRC 15368 / CIP 55.134 / JCM 11481 / NBRC 15587 / NCTC 10816 / Prevot 55134) TaxID=471856 RepID=C7R2Q0_JONDD|nr:GNAT family N-acetyltransferase [Jonesia denitrificans]ACV10041.1 GCN5-related N-acetyltransferase [Jonesia denitrificans DSM 20603]ASE08727.1 N-acetyltransferase [Jonesia denitrificans]QXB43334.1 GNAT family N-acetyltransferase [Jonesia denitrificans]SQH22853.1 Predicted acetyltransferase [Jonesia denitrificans]